MSTTDHSRFDELMSCYLDAALDEAEERELLQCLSDEELAARFHELTQLDTEIAGLIAGSIPDEIMVGLVLSDLTGSYARVPVDGAVPSATSIPVPFVLRKKPKKQSGPLLALAAVLIGVLGVTALHFRRVPTPATPASITSVRGEVYLVGSGGQSLLSNGQALNGEGTVKTVGPDSRVTLTLKDGTRVELLGNTSFTSSNTSGEQHLFLDGGVIRCSVAKQPAGAPMVFNTPEATVTVRGTELAIVTVRSETLLIVTKGKVALRRSSGGPEVLIEAGFYSRVERSGEFRARPLALLPKVDRDRVLPPE